MWIKEDLIAPFARLFFALSSLLSLALFFTLFFPLYHPGCLSFFFFFLVFFLYPAGLEPLTFCISVAYQSLFYTTTLRGSVEHFPWKIHLYFFWLIYIPKKSHYNILSRLFNACFKLHENMHRISSVLAPRWIKGGGGGIIYLFLPVASTCSSRIISSIDFFKLCKIFGGSRPVHIVVKGTQPAAVVNYVSTGKL